MFSSSSSIVAIFQRIGMPSPSSPLPLRASTSLQKAWTQPAASSASVMTKDNGVGGAWLLVCNSCAVDCCGFVPSSSRRFITHLLKLKRRTKDTPPKDLHSLTRLRAAAAAQALGHTRNTSARRCCRMVPRASKPPASETQPAAGLAPGARGTS